MDSGPGDSPAKGPGQVQGIRPDLGGRAYQEGAGVKLEVKLIRHTADPLGMLWLAYRRAYSAECGLDLLSMRPSADKLLKFIQRRLEVGHSSPLRMVQFVFTIDGLSIASARQIMRHHAGVDWEELSRRYNKLEGPDFDYVIPDAIQEDREASALYHQTMDQLGEVYQDQSMSDIAAENRRYVLPVGMTTSLIMSINYLALQHMCDIRLCTQTQPETRILARDLRAAVRQNQETRPLAAYLGIKCEPQRNGYCDESLKAWKACSVGKVRPHKTQVLELKGWGSGIDRRQPEPQEGTSDPVPTSPSGP